VVPEAITVTISADAGPNPIPVANPKAAAAILCKCRMGIPSHSMPQKKVWDIIVLGMVPRGDTLRQLRYRAIILVGFAGALRRSETQV
jgi:hypothetical protein